MSVRGREGTAGAGGAHAAPGQAPIQGMLARGFGAAPTLGIGVVTGEVRWKGMGIGGFLLEEVVTALCRGDRRP